MNEKEIKEILLAEYRYWRDASESNPNIQEFTIGAMGALANVIAAAFYGHRAPWHPKKEG